MNCLKINCGKNLPSTSRYEAVVIPPISQTYFPISWNIDGYEIHQLGTWREQKRTIRISQKHLTKQCLDTLKLTDSFVNEKAGYSSQIPNLYSLFQFNLMSNNSRTII